MNTKKLQLFTSVILAISLQSACNSPDEDLKILPTPVPVQHTSTPLLEAQSFPENFYFGNDLSYVNEMEDCGAEFREKGELKDVYQIVADNGGNLVRVRHWNDPFWISAIPQPASVASNRKAAYSNIEDNIETLRRSRNAGMDVILDFHFSDFWADPGRQTIPRAWESLFDDQEALSDAIYQYVTDVLTAFDGEDLLPEIIAIGNESNSGMMTHRNFTAEVNENGDGLDIRNSDFVEVAATRTAAVYNAGITAVRDFGRGRSDAPKIALHLTIDRAITGYDRLINSLGVSDFDIIGLSYYYAWHRDTAATIPEAGNFIRQLKSRFPAYDVMLMETGYLWDNENIDGNNNIINVAAPEYLPVSKQNQLKYLVDLSQEVADAGGSGVVFWEPAWVSTECRTPWAQGSSHEHVAYFDHRDNNNFHIGGRWMAAEYLGRKPTEGVPTTFTVDMQDADVANGVYIRGDFTFDKIQPMLNLGDNIYRYTLLIPADASGSYHILNGPEAAARESVPRPCADIDDQENRAFVINSAIPRFGSVWQSCEVLAPNTPEKATTHDK